MNKIYWSIFILIISTSQIICQAENPSYISENKMKTLESLKMRFYNKYNLSAAEIRKEYNDQIVLDTTIVVNEADTPYDSLIIVQTNNFVFGFGKSIKRKHWDLIGLYSESEEFFNEFGLNKQTTFKDIKTKFDSTDSYIVGVGVEEPLNEDSVSCKFVISFKDTEMFIFFTEFTFYIQSGSLQAINIDFLENR